LASSVLFDKEHPTAPVNRRISIIVLNRATERAIGLDTLGDGVKPETMSPEAAVLPPPLPAADLSPPSVAPKGAAAPAQPATDLERELLKALENPSPR
jgi:chemotaxis protein MotB